MPSGKSNTSGSGERLGREPAPVLLPHQRRVEAFLDRRPDRERRREVVPGHDEVGAIPDAHLVDLREQLVGGVRGEHVGQAGLDADADEREPIRLLPASGVGELLVAEHHAESEYGRSGCGRDSVIAMSR